MEASDISGPDTLTMHARARSLIVLLLLLCVLVLTVPGFSPGNERELVDRIVAVVNDQVVTEAELLKALSADQVYLSLLEREDADDPKAEIKSRKLKVLNLLIEKRLVVSEGKRLGIKPDQKLIKDRIERTMKRFNLETDEEFEQVLRREGLTLDLLKGMYSDDYVEQVLLDGRVRSAISVSEAQIRAYYQNNRASFTSSERVNFAQILLKVEDFSDEQLVRTTRARAQAILNLLRTGKSFDEVCQNEDDALSSCDGLGFLEKGEMFDSVSKIAFELNIGDVSGVVRSPMGFHIIKLLDKQGGGTELGPELKRKIRETLIAEQFEKRYSAYMKELRTRSHIRIMMTDAP